MKGHLSRRLCIQIFSDSKTTLLLLASTCLKPSTLSPPSATLLTPKDSRAPVVVGIDTGIGRLSPNADGTADAARIDVLFSESVSWSLSIRNVGGTVVETASGSGGDAAPTWDGLVGGKPVADGSYSWSVRGGDAWQNGTATASGTLVVDTAGPTLTIGSPAADATASFSPNGDGGADVLTLLATSSEAGTLTTRITNAAGTYVRTLTTTAAAGTTAVSWDGRAGTGAVVADGDYRLTTVARDAAGNAAAPVVRTVRVVTLMGFVRTSTPVFFPQDLDRFSPTATLSFKAARAATVSWVLKNSAGAVVITHLDHAAVAAGTTSWVFDGRGPDGTMLPPGVYASSVTATDGVVSTVQAARVEMNAFALTTSRSTARRGSSITVTAQSAEPLTGSVQLRLTQPGVSATYVTMSKVATNVYRATVTVKTGGSAGTASFRVSAFDADGRWQATNRNLPLS